MAFVLAWKSDYIGQRTSVSIDFAKRLTIFKSENKTYQALISYNVM